MKVAIPLFNNRVSPRFEFAPSLLLARVENNQVMETQEINLKDYDLFQRCALLKDLAVDTLICGGIQGFVIRSLSLTIVQVITPISGEAEEALQSFLQGGLKPPFVTFPPFRKEKKCRRGYQKRWGCEKNKQTSSASRCALQIKDVTNKKESEL